MTSEIELYFGGDEAYMTVTPVEARCPTELMHAAHRMAREQHAIHVSFGPPIPRDEDGLPEYNPKKK